jgi:hypothetical protein
MGDKNELVPYQLATTKHLREAQVDQHKRRKS